MPITHLIRRIGGVEALAPGCWSIARSQPVHLTDHRFTRRIDERGRTTDGVLQIAEDPLDSWFELTIEVPARHDGGAVAGDADPPASSTLAYRGALSALTESGLWQVDGEMTLGGICRTAAAVLRYDGVFRTGDQAHAWFHLHAPVAMLLPGARGRHRRGASGARRVMTVDADLAASAPSTSWAPRMAPFAPRDIGAALAG